MLFYISEDDTVLPRHSFVVIDDSIDIIFGTKNSREGYIKADQLYYFKKDKLNYYVLATISEDLLNELIKLIVELELENKLKQNTKNIEETVQ